MVFAGMGERLLSETVCPQPSPKFPLHYNTLHRTPPVGVTISPGTRFLVGLPAIGPLGIRLPGVPDHRRPMLALLKPQ